MLQTNEVLQLLNKKRGTIATLTTLRAMKVRKDKEPIQKLSTFQARVGVEYDNIKAVQDKRASGELPAQNQGLPWGQWYDYPHIIEHKGEYYYRCTRVRNQFVPQVTFLRNGIEITKAEAEQDCLASEFRDGDDNEVFTIKVASLQQVK
jgi:hypothetical protein